MVQQVDIMRPDVLARMSVYYNMSFNGVMVRAMQMNPISKEKYKELKLFSNPENTTELYALYTDNNLATDILKPTYDLQISPNIMTVLEKNYNDNLF